jgi:hypothetical protein
MRQLFITSLLLAAFLNGSAQIGTISGQGCGTITTPQEMQALAAFLSDDTKAKTTNGNDTIPLSIHIVGNDNGGGYYKLDHLFTVLCELNTRFVPAGFYFSIKWPINYINNTSYYSHDFSTGYNMMASNNVSNSVNVYFVDDPGGACGYFSPSADGIAIKKTCSNPNSTTLTHELGHFFGLPHTFNGWEHGSTPWNPEKVTRGVGANCSSTGDLFCDTDADYLSDRWYCPYTGNQLDVTGTPYHPDSSLYMSYSSDNCQSRFSTMQIARMQNNLHAQRANLLQGHIPAYSALDFASMVYPNDSLYANNTNIRWRKVAGADYYQVKIVLQNNGIVKQEALTSDTSLATTFNMIANIPYKVTITPISSKNMCREKSKAFTYYYSLSTPPLSVEAVNDNDNAIALYPNPASNSVSIDLISVAPGQYTLQVSNINGQKVYEQMLRHNGGSQKVTVPLENLVNGIYLVRLTGTNNNWTQKLVIQK